MALQVTSFPVNTPSGVRFTAGTINFNGATYVTAGLAVSIAQWGGNANGIPNRQPDFVLLSGALPDITDGATGNLTAVRWHDATSKIMIAGTEPLVDEHGLGEDDGSAVTGKVNFLAIWIESTPGTVT